MACDRHLGTAVCLRNICRRARSIGQSNAAIEDPTLVIGELDICDLY